MHYIPSHLRRWTLPKCYFGAEWPEYYSAGVGQNRESAALDRSNFRCVLKALGGESETVRVVRENHWAVGLVEWIAIHESDEKALEIADEIAQGLEDYPIVNESDFSELEQEDADETWRGCYDWRERLDYVRQFRNQFEFRSLADAISCIRGDYFGGYPSELLI